LLTPDPSPRANGLRRPSPYRDPIWRLPRHDCWQDDVLAPRHPSAILMDRWLWAKKVSMRVLQRSLTLRPKLLMLILMMVLSLSGCQSSAVGASSEPCCATPEPAAAAAFIAAQRDRDTDVASRVTSPLYHAEMSRRGLGAQWPLRTLWVDATAQLSFSFVGEVSDSHGFTYALYTARPKTPVGAQPPTSLWRIDLDPEGRVIWGELARVFDRPDVRVTGGRQGALHLSSLAQPATISPYRRGQQLAFVARSEAGDAYVAFHPDPADPGGVVFAQEDASGALGPSYWSYGQATRAGGDQWQSVSAVMLARYGLADGDVQTLHAYLDALAWSPPGA
jgi:hypothetical protein